VGAVTRLINLPNRIPEVPLEDYVNDSAHHGLSINSAGTTLCSAGTMDDYAAFVDRATGNYTIFDKLTTGHDYLKPYWTTEGLDDTCWISLSDSDAVAVIDFATGTERAFLPVGDHPQRVRHGYVREEALAAAAASAKATAQGKTSLTAAEPLSRLDSPPAPMVTDRVTSAGASLLGGQPGPWLPATMLGLLMLASLAFRMRAHPAVVRTKLR